MDGLAGRKNELAIVHQTGERDYNAVRTRTRGGEFHAEVVPFLSNMAERFAWADVIVCRAEPSPQRKSQPRAEPPSLSLWKSNGQPSIAQRPRDGARGRRPAYLRSGTHGEKLTAENFLSPRPASRDRKTFHRCARNRPPSCRADIVNLMKRPQTCRNSAEGRLMMRFFS